MARLSEFSASSKLRPNAHFDGPDNPEKLSQFQPCDAILMVSLVCHEKPDFRHFRAGLARLANWGTICAHLPHLIGLSEGHNAPLIDP